MSNKIIPINGMTHLMDEANPKMEQKPVESIITDGTCLKLRCILESTDYYIPDGNAAIMMNEPPYHPFAFAFGYSECKDPATGKVISVTKHLEKRFFQTGISTEIVKCPAWWAKRDEGMI